MLCVGIQNVQFGASLIGASRTEFNNLLVDSVNEAITDILGPKVNEALWYHYQAYVGVTRDEIPYQLDTFFNSLKTVFGLGGETLGRVIVKKLYAKANVPLQLVPDRPLSEYVETLKQILAEDLMQ
jgi:hypothetical protein